ncbi:MAG: hypothetical protein HXS41_15825 [Theionarchaea archaeon]|nr:hypothetical protein [Theionarchaea archaeon]
MKGNTMSRISTDEELLEYHSIYGQIFQFLLGHLCPGNLPFSRCTLVGGKVSCIWYGDKNG